MAGLISPSTLEQIRAASDIVDIIGGYLPLKRAGANFTALCPFHKEKSPSFNVNPHKQIFHCFGCHKGGDVFGFVRDYENIGFVDAVRRLAERAKIPLEMDNNPHAAESRHLKDQLLTIHDQLTTRWQNCLANEAAGQVARDYLAKRGVSADAIKLFRIGAAPESWDDTVNWAKSKGFDLATVEKAGLILKKEGGEHHYDRFRGRLMFPICDEQSRVIGFSGRVLSGDEKTAKYVNSPETAIFTKSKVFFGLDKSKRAILDAGFAIICEGQLDLIACFMGGVQNIVAPQGTAFTEQHARIIKRYVDEVVLCFDADNAGQNATVRALDSLLASGLAVRVAVVPAPHDPDSFIKAHGGEAFAQVIQSAPGFFDYYLNRLCAQHDATTDKGRLAILRAMAEAVHKTGNSVVVDTHAQKTALRLGVAPEAVRAEFTKIARSAKPAFTPAASANEDYLPNDAEADAHAHAADSATEVEIDEPLTPPNPQEHWLLRLLLADDDTAPWLAAHLNLDWIPHPHVREIISRRLAAEASGQWRGLAAFLSESESPALQALICETSAETRTIPNVPQQLADLTLRLRNQFLDRQLTALTQRASQPELSDDVRLELLQQQQDLRKTKQSPL
ncbi:MAG: primase [Verrucomicrobiota bacterium]